MLGNYAGVTVLSIGAAYLMFKLLSEKWLNAKFDERLAAYKHAQQRELEQLKGEISVLLDRTLKLHQREFDVLPEVWGRLFNAVNVVTLGFSQAPNVNSMTEAQLHDLLEKSEFAAWQKDELRAARDKTRYYTDTLGRRNLHSAHVKFMEFDAYLMKSGIFIPNPIKSQLTAVALLMHEAIMERRFPRSHNEPPDFDKGLELHQRGRAMLKDLESSVQTRLRAQGQTPP